jgi:hypothetical protein
LASRSIPKVAPKPKPAARSCEGSDRHDDDPADLAETKRCGRGMACGQTKQSADHRQRDFKDPVAKETVEHPPGYGTGGDPRIERSEIGHAPATLR